MCHIYYVNARPIFLIALTFLILSCFYRRFCTFATMKRRILFVINPVSGTGRQKTAETIITTHIDNQHIEPHIVYTQKAKHAFELSKEAIGVFDAVVAVGGDGTVNEVSRALIDTQTALGIIPVGSGNGLAHYLQIPLTIEKAVKVINDFQLMPIDTININNLKYVNVAGVGFDAFISHKFAGYGKRGILSYLKLIIEEFFRYKAKKYKVRIDGKKYKKRAFLITFANSSEFGNNAHIAPKAKIDDGLIDVCFLKKFPLISAPVLGLRLFNKTMDKSKYSKIIRGKEIQVKRKKKPIVAHIDGEPVTFDKKLNIAVNSLSLHVIVPEKFRQKT